MVQAEGLGEQFCGDIHGLRVQDRLVVSGDGHLLTAVHGDSAG